MAIRLVVTDMDNTLYSWIDYIVPAVESMVDAVALATGLHASRIDGSALKYNEADPKLPDLVVCRKDLAPRLLAALQRHLPSE